MAASKLPLAKVTIQQLEYLDAVTSFATWGAAAEYLQVSPSALSQGLSELERRLGVSIFESHGRKKRIAEDAAPVLGYARRVLADTREVTDWAERRRSGQVGALRVGMIDVGAVHHYPHVLAAFRDEHPDVELRLTVSPSQTLLDQLVAGELDLVVGVSPESPHPELTTVNLFVEPLAVYAPAGTRIGRVDTWGPWVTFPANSLTRRLIETELRSHGATFEVVAESNQPDVLREMVNLSLGWTVLPAVQAETGERPLQRALKQPLTTRQIGASHRASSSNPLVGGLLQSMVEHGSLSGKK